jgi:predicted nucleic acid-binding protein
LSTYVDASVLLRIVLKQPGELPEWGQLTDPISSQLIRIEGLRTIDRARVLQELDDDELAEARDRFLGQIQAFDLIPLDPSVLDRAEDPFPVALGTLDAMHLSTAILAREGRVIDGFATHDRDLGRAAKSEGFAVYGL